MREYIIYGISGVIILILLIGLCRAKTQKVMNVILRGVLGIAILYLVNTVLEGRQMISGVGINPVTVGVSAFLGVPGILLLYGCSFFFRYF
ncbi:MAG: pro-sigmaK processing inhibitor BofA [Lachnospiraceae bacterium]|nr:pro-sigmaK processing inhibitor BofA [Lachnospiraceae bacterium]